MKILIIKLSALGDGVMASSMIKALRGKHKDAQITWLCGKEILPLVKLFKGVDKIISVDNSLLTGDFFSKVRFVLSVWAKVAFRKYDLCILGHSHKLYKLLPLFTFGEKRAFGGRFGPISGRYHGSEYARLALGEDGNFTEAFPLADIDITPDKRAENMVLILAGGAKNLMNEAALKRWPLNNYIELAKLLTAKGIKVGLIGAKSDLWTEEAFDEAGVDCTSFVGESDIKGLAELIAGAKILVSHDSGPRHMADLVKTPSLGLFGPTGSSFYPNNDCVLAVDIHCAPCYDGRFFADCEHNLCMESITPSMVLEKLEQMSII
jgi:heptosyltransferase-2